MPRLTAALLVSLAALAVVLGCDDERRPAPQPTVAGPVATAPEVLECRFDPVSRPGEKPENGFEMCFSPHQPEPWWTRVGTTTTNPAAQAADAAPEPPEDATPDASDAADPDAPCPDEMVL